MTSPVSLFMLPVDIWLFRDGRPFDAGSAHRAESMFPPYPTVIQGAIRRHILELAGGIDLDDKSAENKKKIEALVGGADDFGKLRLRGPYLARKEKDGVVRYFPQPADAFVDGKMLKPAGRMTEPSPTIKTSQVLPLMPELKDSSGKQDGALWISESTLIDYLGGNPVEGLKARTLFESENRTGIGVGSARVVNEGMLYEAGFIRPQKDVGLLVDMDVMDGPVDIEWHKPGILHLGGESRMAYFHPQKTEPLPAAPTKTKRFKVYFATPAYFEKGWCPTSWQNYFAGDVKLVAAAINHYETIGGFDRAASPDGSDAHRPSRRFVPAGSVYYFQGNAEFKSGLVQQAITDFGAEIGFGQTIIKEW